MTANRMNRVDGFAVIPGTRPGPKLDAGRDAMSDVMTCNPGGRGNAPAPSPVASACDRGGAWHILSTLPAGGPRAKHGRVLRVGANNGIISGNPFGQ